MSADQADGSKGAATSELAAQEHNLVDLQAVGDQCGAGIAARAGAGQLAADVGAGEADGSKGAVAGGGEPGGEQQILVDLQSVGEEGGAGFVAQGRLGAFQVAADVGAGQADGPTVSAAGGGTASAERRAASSAAAVGPAASTAGGSS